MLKKRMMILGLAGVLAAGFGVAGCSAESGDETVVNNESVAQGEGDSETSYNYDNSGYETEYVTQNLAEADTDASGISYDDIEMKEVDGKYVYTILDGKVEVPLNHRVEDYCPYGKDADDSHIWKPSAEDLERTKNIRFFNFQKIAEELGYTHTGGNDVDDIPEFKKEWILQRDDKEVTIRLFYQHSGGVEGASGARSSSGLGVSIGNYSTGTYQPENSIDVRQSMDSNLDDAKFLTWDGRTSISLDQIVLTIYALEYEVDHLGEDPFYDLLRESVYYRPGGSNTSTEYVYDREPG